MYGSNDHPDREINEAITRLCVALVNWERATGRQSVLILRENNGENPGERMTEPGYTLRAGNGIPLGRDNDDIPDDDLLRPFTVPVS